MSRHLTSRLTLTRAAIVADAECSDDDSPGPTVPARPVDVTKNFAAAVNGAPVACGQNFANMGRRR